MQLFILNEYSLAPVLVRALLGRRPYLVHVHPLLRASVRPLNFVATWLISQGMVRGLSELPAAWPYEKTFPLLNYRTTVIFKKIEGGVNRSFDYSRPNYGPVVNEYTYAMRKAVSDYVEKVVDYVKLAEWLNQNIGASQWTFRGAPQHLIMLIGLCDLESKGAVQRTSSAPSYLLNVINSLSFALSGTAWLLRRLTFAPLKPEKYRLAADRISPIDNYMFSAVIDDPAELLIVDRNQNLADKYGPTNGEYRSCLKEDAEIGPSAFFKLAARLWRDQMSIWVRAGGVDPNLFYRFAGLAVKRAMFAAFFDCFRPEYFWCRDDYSMDHIIRNQELRKTGGVSIGINHGLPLDTYMPQWREIDCDIYYTFGSHLYESFYKDVWPDHMTVKPVGSLQMKREHRAVLGNTRPKDIAYFPITYGQVEKCMHEVFKIAEHFSDRKIYVKMKAGRDAEAVLMHDRLMAEAPENIVAYSDPDPYPLLLQVSYSLCFTTLVAESLHFGAKTFTFDNEPDFKFNYFRNFPGLTVPDGDTVIERIKAIEDGTKNYDFARYNALINMTGPDIYDVIRQDIGLDSVNTGTLAA